MNIDTSDPVDWDFGEDEPHESLALPGPPLTEEQLVQELTRGLSSGVAQGNVVKRLLHELRTNGEVDKAA